MSKGILGRRLSLLGGALTGAAAMYFFDPKLGPHRRRQFREAAGDAWENTADTLHSLPNRAGELGYDLLDRAGGVRADLAESTRRLTHHAGRATGELPHALLRRIRRLREATVRAGRMAKDYADAGFHNGLMGRLKDWFEGAASSTANYGRELWDRAEKVRRKLSRHPRRTTRPFRREPDWVQRFHQQSGSAQAAEMLFTAVSLVAIGSFMMYLMDPDRGRRRRALLRDRMRARFHHLHDDISDASRHVRDRSRGIVARTRRLFRREQVADPQLHDRIRSKIGRAVSHPSSIHVTVTDGHVTLTGPILTHEVPGLLAAVRSVRGVRDVQDRLEVHDRADSVPGLQGRPENDRPMNSTRGHNWSPTVRLLAGAAGGALCCAATLRRDLLGAAGGIAGLALMTRAVTNREVSRLTGICAGKRAVDVDKSIHINAPVEKVFDFFADFGNFPRFMTNVREVRDVGDGRTHWVVAGPANLPVTWEAEVTVRRPNEALEWKTVPGSAVEHAGIIRLQTDAAGGTLVDFKLSYNPPAGTVGRLIASLFNADPRSQLDEDLMRARSLIESGHPVHHAAQAAR